MLLRKVYDTSTLQVHDLIKELVTLAHYKLDSLIDESAPQCLRHVVSHGIGNNMK